MRITSSEISEADRHDLSMLAKANHRTVAVETTIAITEHLRKWRESLKNGDKLPKAVSKRKK